METKIKIVGVLRLDEDGLRFSYIDYDRIWSKPETRWLEANYLLREWPDHLGKCPEKPKNKLITGSEAEQQRILGENRAAEAEWQRACDSYWKAFHASSEYRRAASEFIELQNREPQPLATMNIKDHKVYKPVGLWTYREKVLSVESTEPEPLRDDASVALLIKHYVLRRDRHYDKVRREVEALENLEKLEKVSREPIPESVRLFVWQRDQGKCVKCGSRERLEFDHIIPLAAGGSNTERNIQLLCEVCNRAKGATI